MVGWCVLGVLEVVCVEGVGLSGDTVLFRVRTLLFWVFRLRDLGFFF